MAARAGIDVGGTFTDGVLLDEQGRLEITKVASTPADLAAGFLEALTELSRPRRAARDRLPRPRLDRGDERDRPAKDSLGRPADYGGLRDVLEIGTQQRGRLYDLHAPKAAPLVPRELRLEVRERIGQRAR